MRAMLPPLAAAGLLLALAGCGAGRGPGAGPLSSMQCVPYARQRSGLPLRGNAASWWDEAAGQYGRSHRPQPGAVLVFRATPRLPQGHVSTVVRLRSAREVVVDHANWVRGHLGRADPVVDVSPGNDWSAVRVWWDPADQLGTTVYPTYGFVLPPSAASRAGDVAEAARPVQLCAR